MADIKVKNKNKGNIKTINKSSIASQRMKGNIVRIRDKTQEENSNNENNITDYGSNKINSTISNTSEKGMYEFNRYGKKSYEETIDNIKTGKRKLDIYKKKRVREKIKKQTEKSGKAIKTVGKSIKSAENTAQKAIKTTGKTVEEMADKYNFNAEQREQLAELTNEKYASMWNSVIYGSSIGSNDIVKVAESQIGNIGGQPYWSWYGFTSRVEWCACFVSWCANECGYIDAGIIPKFAGCQAEGVEWFKTCGLWKDRGFVPKPGDIIFFDWADENTGVRNNSADHVGIVEKVEKGRVYTIEGNSSDSCCRKDYDINSLDILGYGTPLYK